MAANLGVQRTGTRHHLQNLPADGRGPASFAASEERAGELRGEETILLCEDDRKIRRLVQAMLTRQGYHVLVADTPGQALDRFQASANPSSCRRPTWSCPDVTGFELAKAVREVRPSVRVLYMSGYTDNHMGAGLLIDPDINFIQKPFTAAALARQVREALDKQDAAG